MPGTFHVVNRGNLRNLYRFVTTQDKICMLKFHRLPTFGSIQHISSAGSEFHPVQSLTG